MLMVEGGKVGRVDVDSGSIATASGIHIGSTRADVRRAYQGHIRPGPAPYGGERDSDLVFVPGDAADSLFRIVFELDGDTVTRFRAGMLPQIAYIEGCS
jgi:hypothetical protein